jgi:hypothetical protein
MHALSYLYCSWFYFSPEMREERLPIGLISVLVMRSIG